MTFQLGADNNVGWAPLHRPRHVAPAAISIPPYPISHLTPLPTPAKNVGAPTGGAGGAWNVNEGISWPSTRGQPPHP